MSKQQTPEAAGVRCTMRFLLAVALLAALTHVDATEVQGQLKGETQHAEQVVVEAKAGQSLRAGLLGSLKWASNRFE